MNTNSFYNIFYKLKDKIVGYNSLSDDFVVLEPTLYDFFQASINEGKINELKNYHTDLFDTLKDKGFVINESVDELEKIKHISNKTDFDNSRYMLIINPTMNCNFKCWYCYESHVKSSKVTEENFNKIVSFTENTILEKKEDLKSFHISWFGGEPLMYFNKTILPLLKRANDITKSQNIVLTTSFTTNGYLINEKIIDSLKKYNVTSLQITLDGHKERHNKVRFTSKQNGSYDKIVKNIKLCLENELNVNVRINVSEDTLGDLLKVIDDFTNIPDKDKKYLIFSFHEVWQEEKYLHADISNIVSVFREQGFKVDYKGEINRAIDNSCYADKFNQATINYNGDVFKCTARDFKPNSKEGELKSDGSIKWNSIFQKRFDTRFKNKPCLECKILPICNGGCSQHRVENENRDYCIYDHDNDKKMDIVKEKFMSRLYAQ